MPLVSIVTATYNRSDVLRYAVASALHQDMPDWEMLIVGDHCTDDTAEVAASFGDRRIRFVNLPRNIGEQSGPNNEGCQMASGRYVAFLNHDDMWFRDHLSSLLRAIDERGSDLVYGMRAVALPEGKWTIDGAAAYRPSQGVGASQWLLRREMVDRLGGWRSARHCFAAPSQDFLFRAWKAGFRLSPSGVLTVVAIQSGLRPGSYTVRDSSVHQCAWERVASGGPGREFFLTSALAAAAERDQGSMRRQCRALARAAFTTGCSALGLAPFEIWGLLRFGRRGRYIERLRARRGLPPGFSGAA